MPEDAKRPVALLAAEAPPRPFRTNYPEPFASRMAGRDKRPLGDLFGLTNFGVNITRLAPGGCSALRHAHTKQDEFVYILEGRPTLRHRRRPDGAQPRHVRRLQGGKRRRPLPRQRNRRGRCLPRNRRPHGWRRGQLSGRRPRRRDGRWQATDGAQGRRAILSDGGGRSGRGRFRSVRSCAAGEEFSVVQRHLINGIFQLTGRALRQHKPRPIRLGPPGAFSSARLDLAGTGECPEWQRGRTVNPLAKPS